MAWKYSPQQKEKAIELLRRGEPALAVARKLNIGDSTVYMWKKALRDAGEKVHVAHGAKTYEKRVAIRTRHSDLEILLHDAHVIGEIMRLAETLSPETRKKLGF